MMHPFFKLKNSQPQEGFVSNFGVCGTPEGGERRTGGGGGGGHTKWLKTTQKQGLR